MALGLDYAGGRPSGAAIAAAGYEFVVRYLSDGGPSLPGKLLLPDEATDLLAAGVDIVSNWETTADRMLGGYSAGAYDASLALGQIEACGGRRDRPVYFSADWDASEEDQEAIDDYLRGAASILGPEWVGIYGGYWPVSRALDHGTARWAWQTAAWSGGNVNHRIHLYQRIGFVDVDGVQCDVNEARQDDFGQWSRSGSTPPPPEPPLDPPADLLAESIADIREQLCGRGARTPGLYPGWPQLATVADAPATLVDGVAAAIVKLGIVTDAIESLHTKLDAITARLGAL